MSSYGDPFWQAFGDTVGLGVGALVGGRAAGGGVAWGTSGHCMLLLTVVSSSGKTHPSSSMCKAGNSEALDTTVVVTALFATAAVGLAVGTGF